MIPNEDLRTFRQVYIIYARLCRITYPNVYYLYISIIHVITDYVYKIRRYLTPYIMRVYINNTLFYVYLYILYFTPSETIVFDSFPK